MSSILNSFFVFIEITFIDLFIVENYVLSTHSYIRGNKKLILFNNNLHIL